jgi:hypothetical protein
MIFQYTYDCTTPGIANHEVLAGPQLVKICEMSAMDSGSFRFAKGIQGPSQDSANRGNQRIDKRNDV